MDMKVITSIKYGWNTIVWVKIRHMRHFVLNLLGVKVYASCKISKKKNLSERQSYSYYQEKNQDAPTSFSYKSFTMK